ncbi:MAG: transposase, partial [Candidatus Electrothrix sp. AUS3]|nr:transposase [Candidatus Electrothrix gigas]
MLNLLLISGVMHNKNIKRIVQKELKKNYPNWNRLNRKTKKEISRKVLAQVAGEYDFKQEISVSSDELLGVEQQVQTKGIISLDQMADIVNESKNNNIIKLCGESRFAKYIKDEELRFIDQLLDNEIINRLLAYEGYSPAMRDLFPHNMFRAELLKTIKYPEISYRKFCDKEYLGLDRKQNRAFIGLSLREKAIIDHTQLSKFRHSLTFIQQINITVYILHHFLQSGMLGDHILHGVDSTELANECKIPLASLNINGQKIRIYSDLDSDCGKRRNKRDKSVYVVGYRLHT